MTEVDVDRAGVRMRGRPGSYYQTNVRMPDGWYIMEGDHPAIPYALEKGHRGDFARWLLKMAWKDWLRAWKPLWVIKMPPEPYTMRFEPSTPRDRALAWLVTAYAIWKAL